MLVGTLNILNAEKSVFEDLFKLSHEFWHIFNFNIEIICM